MWKCPNCGEKNRIDVCSKCGYEKTKDKKASISSFSFILMAVLSLAIIIGIFFCVDLYIDHNNRQKAEQYSELNDDISEMEYFTGEEQSSAAIEE